MAELIPAPFSDLVTRLYLEPQRQNALFELSRRHWFTPVGDGPDLGVAFHGHHAGNAVGPAAGPHTQMAQNLLLSYVAGSRILELKTVQVDDRLTIGRPCIDMTNVGYNIEWSQELLVADALREYVAGAMLIEMFRRGRTTSAGLLSDAQAAGLEGPAGDVIYDTSVGYDLAGIRSEKVSRFLDGMHDAAGVISDLRSQIPRQFQAARDLDYPTRLSDSITLSTFHGCPADEIERICEHLIGEKDFDVVVKMNPPTLGRERVEHLLHEVLGYTELMVNPTAYSAVIAFEESVQLCRRLTAFAEARGRRVGFKFSNTLEVVNQRDFFPRDAKIMYLSGQPLFVITLTLTDEFRRAVGPEVPISFSAGVDRQNFAALVACGFVPITISTDLLRPGGYGRLPAYLNTLENEMRRVEAGNVEEVILRRYGQAAEARRRAAAGVDADAVRWAGLLNTTIAAEEARNEPRYRAARNRAVPKRIDSHLTTFDCINCDKCLPVCPNAANFVYPTPTVAFDFHDLVVAPDGSWRAGATRRFEIEETQQIACYADFCNECGNCDTFCPEYGGPYIKKPTFFGGVQSWERAAPRDGFVVERDGAAASIRGRVKGRVYQLRHAAAGGYEFTDGSVSVSIEESGELRTGITVAAQFAAEHTLDMWAFHTLRHLLAGVLDRSRINQVNAGWTD